MPRISEVITIHPGMSSTVNLKQEFLDIEKNRKRMQGYKPIKSQREIFLKIAKSTLPTENKVHLLVGHYGTGKSHLLLMLANYFSNRLDMPELKSFFETFDNVDKNVSKQIRNLRGSGRYLVVIPDYASQEDFSETLLMALEDAFEREGILENIDSIYEEAIRLLESWEAEETSGEALLPKFSRFKEALSGRTTYNSIIMLRNGLKNREQNALDTLKETYKKLIGTNFRYDASNIVNILKDLLSSKKFKERFRGIVFLYDEFDHTLKGRKISIQVVQQFAELCKNSNDILFIGSLHKELSSFADEYSVEDFKTVQQRFETTDMRTEGLEEIVGAIVTVERDNPVFAQRVAPGLQQVYQKINDITRLNLFDWLSPEDIKEKIIDAVYPLHPLTMACLLKLSTDIGSANRTLFTFLGGEGIDADNEYSYKSFINRTEILDKNGLLNLYTTDKLADYFYRELTIDNVDLRDTIKKIVNGYQTSLKELKNYQSKENNLVDLTEQIYYQILKLMLIFEIVAIPNNQNNLRFGLNFQPKDKKLLNNKLEDLTHRKIIFYNRTAGVYEFRRGTDIDWDNLIQNEKERIIKDGEIDLAGEFISIYRQTTITKFLDGKKFNKIKNADKRVLCVYEEVKNFGQDKLDENNKPIGYFRYFEEELLKVKDWRESYDGVVIYVIAETEDEIREAKEIVKNNDSDYVLAVIPQSPIPVKDAFLELKAALNVKNSTEYAAAPVADQSRLEESYIGNINKGRVKKFTEIRDKYANGRHGIWCGKNGKILETTPTHQHDPIHKFLNNLYSKFNNINNQEMNFCHKPLSGNKEIILRDAINDLLEAGNILEIDESYGLNKGFIKFLKNVLYDKQMLTKTDKKGNIIYCEIEKETDKYKDTFPAVVDMIEEVAGNKRISVPAFINKYRIAPYGLGEVSLELFTAFVIKYFGDEISYRQDSNYPGEIIIQSFEQVKKIVNEPKPYAVLEKREFDEIQKQFLIELYKLFSTQELTVNKKPTIRQVGNLLQQWFYNLPRASKSEEFYTDDKLKSFLQFMKEFDKTDPYRFIFKKFQVVWGYDEELDKFTKEVKAAIIEDLPKLKKQIEEKVNDIKGEILDGFLDIFDAEGKTYSSLKTAIDIWYNALDNNQRSISEDWQNSDSAPLIRYLKATESVQEIIFATLPSCPDYGFGNVSDWNTNNVRNYLDKVQAGVKRIKENKILVDLPIISVENGDEKKDKKKLESTILYDNIDEVTLTIELPQKAKEIWISYQGEDPRQSEVQKEKISEKKTFQPTASEQTIKLVATDGDGNFSQIYTVNLRDKTYIKEKLYEFEVNIPKNSKESKATFRALANKLIERKTVTIDQIVKILTDLAEEYQHGN